MACCRLVSSFRRHTTNLCLPRPLFFLSPLLSPSRCPQSPHLSLPPRSFSPFNPSSWSHSNPTHPE